MEKIDKRILGLLDDYFNLHEEMYLAIQGVIDRYGVDSEEYDSLINKLGEILSEYVEH
jgi:hypothetical protein